MKPLKVTTILCSLLSPQLICTFLCLDQVDSASTPTLPKPEPEFRPQTPILEDPGENRRPSIETSTSLSSTPVPASDSKSSSSSTPDQSEQEGSTSATASTSDDQRPSTASTMIDEMPPSEDRQKEEPSQAPQVAVKALVSDKGKSKVTGRTIGGWL